MTIIVFEQVTPERLRQYAIDHVLPQRWLGRVSFEAWKARYEEASAFGMFVVMHNLDRDTGLCDPNCDLDSEWDAFVAAGRMT